MPALGCCSRAWSPSPSSARTASPCCARSSASRASTALFRLVLADRGSASHPLARSRSLWDQTLPLPPAARRPDRDRPLYGDVAGPDGQSLRLLVRRDRPCPCQARALPLAGRRRPGRDPTPSAQRFDRLPSLALGSLVPRPPGRAPAPGPLRPAPLRRIAGRPRRDPRRPRPPARGPLAGRARSRWPTS